MVRSGVSINTQTDYSSVWELYGLFENPFSTNPLLVSGGILPIECFVGRDKENTRIKQQFRSKGGSRVLVVGEVGVGKTSFVNFAKYQAITSDKFFAPSKEIEVQEIWTSQDFVLNTLFVIYSSIISNKDGIKKSHLSEETFKKLQSLVELNTLTNRGVGGSVLNISFQYNEERQTPATIPYLAIKDLLSKIVNEIYVNSKKETILHYNNLENIKEKSIKKIFDNLRDFFQTPYIHFVFIGNEITNSIIQSLPRLASILSDTIILNTMSYSEIKKIIDERFNILKIKNDEIKVIKPFDESAMVLIYNLYNGNIREILNSLNTAVLEVTENLPVTLNKNDIARILNSVAEERFISPLSERVKQVLELIVKNGEITNKGIYNAMNIDKPNVSIYVHNLIDKGLVYLKRKVGKDKFWSARPEIKWVLLKTDKNQQLITKFNE